MKPTHLVFHQCLCRRFVCIALRLQLAGILPGAGPLPCRRGRRRCGICAASDCVRWLLRHRRRLLCSLYRRLLRRRHLLRIRCR